MAPVGRFIVEDGASDSPQPGLGAWLVQVPEPATLVMLATGLAGLGARRPES